MYSLLTGSLQQLWDFMGAKPGKIGPTRKDVSVFFGICVLGELAGPMFMSFLRFTINETRTLRIKEYAGSWFLERYFDGEVSWSVLNERTGNPYWVSESNASVLSILSSL